MASGAGRRKLARLASSGPSAKKPSLVGTASSEQEEVRSAYFSSLGSEEPAKPFVSKKRRKHVPVELEGDAEMASKSQSNESDKTWEPAHWREQLEQIKVMRSERNAPVDSMGAEVLADKDASPKVSSS